MGEARDLGRKRESTCSVAPKKRTRVYDERKISPFSHKEYDLPTVRTLYMEEREGNRLIFFSANNGKETNP
jgi:hypothetical protein